MVTLTLLTSCHDYHDDMIKWTDGIPIGTDFQTVKSDQPGYLAIDWDNPDTTDNSIIRYNIIGIKGHNDI